MRLSVVAYRSLSRTALIGSLLLLPFAVEASPNTALKGGSVRDCRENGGKRHESVLERFRTYSGERAMDALIGLFTPPVISEVRQLPLVAISDGSAGIQIAVKVPVSAAGAPGFSFEGATMLSLLRNQHDEWVIRALPDPGALCVTLLIQSDSGVKAWPLTVAPPVPAGIGLDEKDFGRFLESGASGSHLGDINGDGRRDYVDDYIYTANFISARNERGRDPKARRERALKRTLVQPPAQPKAAFDPDMF